MSWLSNLAWPDMNCKVVEWLIPLHCFLGIYFGFKVWWHLSLRERDRTKQLVHLRHCLLKAGALIRGMNSRWNLFNIIENVFALRHRLTGRPLDWQLQNTKFEWKFWNWDNLNFTVETAGGPGWRHVRRLLLRLICYPHMFGSRHPGARTRLGRVEGGALGGARGGPGRTGADRETRN